MIADNPANRISLEEILQHDWMKTGQIASK
jgi:hypothetical protein